MVFTALIPQPVYYQLLAFCRLSEGKTAAKVFFEGNGKVVGLKSMEGDIYFVQRGCVQQNILLLFQQSAVGGEYDLETGFSGQFQKAFQFGVAKGFSH